MKVRVGDTVMVIAGSDKGMTGEILSINHKTNKVVVEGVNKVKKHIKPSQSDPEGGIQTVEAPIDASNVAYYDTKAKAKVKLGYKFEDGKKVRVNKATGEVIKEKKK
ncbi:50S ribosomal protein L24 [Kandleria sp.]|uniref:50S ribosomal protein L24 n=1 Tax=Kandleria sp. TaxID=2774291 RepID=UPI000EE8441B|nr:50S ribosomal protein L24 [Kandleria sp.]MBP3275391.1 50S ribosomal protein L24 [Kandleria sp.]HAH76166.1 50S ribosomal protein L24 [Kandleria vitulina]